MEYYVSNNGKYYLSAESNPDKNTAWMTKYSSDGVEMLSKTESAFYWEENEQPYLTAERFLQLLHIPVQALYSEMPKESLQQRIKMSKKYKVLLFPPTVIIFMHGAETAIHIFCAILTVKILLMAYLISY